MKLKLKKIIACLGVLMVSAFHAWCAQPVEGMRGLLASPDVKMENVFFGQTLNTRLDMMDYYDAGGKTYSIDDIQGSKIRIDSLSERHVSFELEKSLKIDMYLLTPGNDSLAVTVINMPVGNGDVFILLDDIKSGETIGEIELPYSEWLTKDALNQVSGSALLAAVPFVTATAQVDTENNTITLTNTSIEVPGLDASMSRYFLPKKTLRYKNKRFK